MDLPAGFRFVQDVDGFDDPAAHVVRIPARLRRRQKLFADFHRTLHLPDYFGWNWDALDECLRDLSWLAEPRRVVVVHAGVPFAPQGRNRPIYLGLLRDLVTAGQGKQIEAIFPESSRFEVEQALAPTV